MPMDEVIDVIEQSIDFSLQVNQGNHNSYIG